jgi:hypothetical protein
MNATNTKPPSVLLPSALRPTWCETAHSKAASATIAKRLWGLVRPDPRHTPMYRLRTPPQEVGRASSGEMRRGSLRAAEEITGHKKYETIGRWLRLAAEHAEVLSAKCWSMISSSPHWRWMSSGRL